MMAVDLHNYQLLLPSQPFTPQEDHLGSELSSTIGSDQLSSSFKDSSQEEDDNYMGELTRQMAQYMLLDEDKPEKPWDLSGSPESTLWPRFGWNLDSPIGPSRVPSPPLAPMVENFAKMKINEETARYNQVSGGNLNAGFKSKKTLIDDQIRGVQLYMKQTERKLQNPRTKHYLQSKGRVFGGYNSYNPWYNLQQQSHTRAVFLNASGTGNDSCGTGVFLPRGIGKPVPSHAKQGSKKRSATVLIPARVVQALKLHFEKISVPTRSNNSGFPLQHDACVSGRNNSSMHSLHKGQSKIVPAMNLQEMGLPQE